MLFTKQLKQLFLAATLCFAASSHAGVILTFDNTDLTVGLNETVTLNLLATTENQIDAISSFTLGAFFDDAAFSLQGIDIDAAFFPGFAATSSEFVGSSLFPVSGNGFVIATLSFVATAVGAFSIEVDSALLTPFGGISNALFNASDFTAALAQITVTDDSQSLPVPAVLSLVIGAFVFVARRKA